MQMQDLLNLKIIRYSNFLFLIEIKVYFLQLCTIPIVFLDRLFRNIMFIILNQRSKVSCDLFEVFRLVDLNGLGCDLRRKEEKN